MELKWFLYFIMFIKASSDSTQVKDLHYFRCLLEDTFEPCIVFPETSSHNVTVFSYKLKEEYANLSADIHYAIEHQNLTLISEENLEKIPDGILLLFPVNHLSSINQRYLMNLIIQRSRSFVVKHLVKAYLVGSRDEYFNEKLQTVDLPVRSLMWIADVISSDAYGAKDLINPPLLFYAPPFSLLFNNTSEKLFYLSLWERSNHISKEISKTYLRFWAFATLKNSFPGALNNWNDLCLERWGTLLTASTSDELKLLNHSNIDNLQLLFSFGFSSIQVRTLFEEFAEQLMNSRLSYFTLSNLLIGLLPDQLLFFSKIIPYIEQIKVLPSIKSIPTSKQIFELLLFEKELSDEKGYGYINNFSYVLPLKTLSETLKQTLPLSSLIKIQSNHFSKSQLFILSSRSEVFDFDSEYIFECKDLIKVLPARDIIFNQTASHVLLHLLSMVAADNIPQSFSILNKLWTLVGSSDVFKKIIANKNSDVLLEYIPFRSIAKFANNILNMIGENINSHSKLPDSFVSSLLISLREAEHNLSILNVKESLEFMFNGISCDDISTLDPYDFVVFMAKFTEQRKISGKDFPKALQQCCVDKLFAYIELKSSLFQRILGESKLSLLNEAEIDFIGGYIFSALPIEPVAKAKYSKRIIKTIGELSLTELIIAAPITRLQGFGTVLVDDDIVNEKKIDFPLFDLGNLTLFLEKKFITKINETYFQLLLESSFIDRRVCTNKSSRLAWFNLLKQCFGETNNWSYQTLVTLGDLLIVVPNEELDKVPSNSWKYAADVLISHYNDIIKYSSLKFYEVCMLQLNQDEAQLYFNDLKYLVKVFTDAAQLQLNTVTTVEELKNRNKSDHGIFTYINSRKSNIKISIPPIENVINSEKPAMKNRTEIHVTESLNKDGNVISDSFEHNVSSSTPRVPNIHTISLENMIKTTVNNGCSYSINCHSFQEETTAHYLGFTTRSSTIENSYSTFNQSGTTKEINEKTATSSGLPNFIFNITELNMPSENDFNLTTPLDDITVSKFSNSTGTDGKDSSLYDYDPNSRNKFTTKDHSSNAIQSSTFAFQNELTASTIGLPSKIFNHKYNFNSSGFETDYNDSLSESNLSSTTNSIITVDRSLADITTPAHSEKLVTDSSDYISKMSSIPISKTLNEKMPNEFKDVNKVQFENLLKNHNAKTEYLKLNFSLFKSKTRKSSFDIIGNARRGRVERSIGQYSCEALKMVGKLAEIVVSEELIRTMSKEDVNECVDLFSDMDLPIKVKKIIWEKSKLNHIFLYGKLISAIDVSDVENMNFSMSTPWALETISLIGRYSIDLHVRNCVIKNIIGTKKLRYTVELLVTLGSLICELPEITFRSIEPSELLKASVILGRNLPCNHSCLLKLSNIAVKEGAFEDPSKWNTKDVSDLGIIVAGLQRIHWKKLLHSKKRPLRGLSEQAFKCLPPEYIEELELQYNMNLSKIYLKGPDLFDRSIHFDFFETSNDSFTLSNESKSHSVPLISFYLDVNLQIFFIAIILFLNHH